MTSKKTPYEVLGVGPNVSPEDAVRAYRRRARDTHPDRCAGEDKEFIEVKKAFDLISDPERRKRYDETGDERDKKHLSFETELLKEFQEILLASFKDGSTDYANILLRTSQRFKDKISTARTNIEACRKAQVSMGKVLKRLKDPSGLLVSAVTSEIEQAKIAEQSLTDLLGLYERAAKYLEMCSYEVESIFRSNFEWAVNGSVFPNISTFYAKGGNDAKDRK